jgi:dolichol-phosphate mannosyltransferase
MAGRKVVYSLVVPIYNEEAVLPRLLHRLDRLLEQLDAPAEVILVDDGSRDISGMMAAARAQDNPAYRYVGLSRNFGHQIAITAGMERAQGDAIIVMDADLQDPPEVVLELIAKWREGFDIVYAKRKAREGESFLKLATAHAFYRVLRRLSNVDIPENVGDFRLIDRKVLEAFKRMPERDRFVRGMFGWLGFRQSAVEFHRDARAAGETKYGWRKMFRLATDGIIGFSDAPLRAVLWLGAAVSALAMLYGAFVIGLVMMGSATVQGWASLAVLISLLAGMNLMTVGVVGLYVGRIHNEVKQRPLYIVGREEGFREAQAAAEPSGRRQAL